MELYYCKTPDGNFGDDMNLWFWDRLIPNRAALDPSRTLFGIGTIISRKHFAGRPGVVVAGSGVGYGVVDRMDLSGVDFAWVRGPRTAAALGLEPGRAITDPACAVARLGLFETGGGGGRLFIPHRITAGLGLDWLRIAADTGLEVVSPKEDAMTVIGRIARADLVVSESMHGAIVADAFGVPWIPIAISHHFNSFKWGDWADSVEVPLVINPALSELRSTYFALRNALGGLRRIARRSRPRDGGAVDGRIDFSNPNFMERDERRFVKAAVAALHRPIERMLVRDLKRALAARPGLSAEHVRAERVDRIFAACADIARRYA